MGLPPTWKVGDLNPSYSTPVEVVPATAIAVISAAYNPQGNSIALYPRFSDGLTSCSLAVLNDDGTGTFVQVASFDNINLFNAESCTVGEWPTGISLGGRAIEIAVSNLVGPGSVNVFVQRLN
jgi:hypothetical protein